MSATSQTLPLVGEASLLAVGEATEHGLRITALSQATITAATAKLAATNDPRYAALITIATQTMQKAMATSAEVIVTATALVPEFA
ncbi:hypothetical protein ACNOYE_30950 [Nannocystaceae bacterium ST9]